MTNKIFLDFDNTLAHSLYASDEKHADSLLYDYGEHFVGAKFNLERYGWHVSFKRVWCDDLILFCKQLVGPDNVYILTTGVQDYIKSCNIHLKLGFDTPHIFAREDIRNHDTHPLFKETFNVLVDDLSYREHHRSGKIRFLNNIPHSQFIQVHDFNVWSEPLGEDKEYFGEVTSEILNVINH